MANLDLAHSMARLEPRPLFLRQAVLVRDAPPGHPFVGRDDGGLREPHRFVEMPLRVAHSGVPSCHRSTSG